MPKIMPSVASRFRVGLFLLCLLAFGILNGQSLRAQAPTPPSVVLTNDRGRYPLDAYIEVLSDPSGTLTLEDVRSARYASSFVPLDSFPNPGLDGGTIWARLHVRNNSTVDDWLLKLRETRLGYLDVFRLNNADGTYTALHTGSFLPTSTREISHHRFLFHLTALPGAEQTIWMRLQAPLSYGLAMEILSPDVSAQADRSENMVHGLFLGAMLIIAGYNFFLFISLRDLAFLYLALVVFGFALSNAASDGTGQTYLWPSSSNRWTVEYSILFTMLAASLLTTTFLNLKQTTPRLHRAFLAWRVVLIGTAILVPLVNTIPVIISLMAIELVMILAASWFAWHRGFRPARLFLLSWFLPLVATLVYVLVAVGVLPATWIENNLILVSLAALGLLWSIALADRIRLTQAEAQRAQSNLAVTENRYQSLFQDSHDAVFITTRNGEILDLNPAGLELFGYTRVDLPALRAPNLFLLPAEYTRWQQLLEQNGAAAEYEAQMRARDGTALTVVISSTRWRDERNRLAGYQGILRDVTERRRTQQELASYRLHLEELVAARTAQARIELAERERAEAALERRVQELSVLNEVSKTMSTVTDLVPALRAVAASIAQLFGVQAVAIYEIFPAQQTAQLLVTLPEGEPTDAPADAPKNLNLPPALVHTQTPLVLHRSHNAAEVETLSGFLPPLPYETFVLAPLHVGGTRNSLLFLASERGDVFAQTENLNLLETIGSTIATAIENVRLFEQAQRAAVAFERQRLARELHDSVTQLLYSIVLLAGGWSIAAEKNDSNELDVRASFSELAELGQQALSEMRLLLYQLQSPVLAQLGLSGALKQRIKAVEERVGIQTTFYSSGDVDLVPLQLQAELYFIAQEALNNALRHARASAIQVLLTRQNDQLKLVVQDNGAGFDPQTVSEGMGLRNMFARAQSIGAEIEFYSGQGDGTRVQLLMQLPAGED